MTGQLTLFVVDPDAPARRWLIDFAATRGVAAEEFSSAEEFLAACDNGRAGCVVAELHLPGIGGIELLDSLRASGNMLPVIFLTAHADIPATVRAMRSGAITLLEKPGNADALGDAIAHALADEQLRSERQARRLDTLRRMALLSDQEQRVMQLVVEGRLNKVIARTLDVSTRTVERDRASLMKKLGVESVAQLVERVVDARE